MLSPSGAVVVGALARDAGGADVAVADGLCLRIVTMGFVARGVVAGGGAGDPGGGGATVSHMAPARRATTHTNTAACRVIRERAAVQKRRASCGARETLHTSSPFQTTVFKLHNNCQCCQYFCI